jgi:hypothetical protein
LTQGATPSPSPSPAANSNPFPGPSGTLLFAALEAKGTTGPFGWNTLAIAGLDGYARAKTTFVPMPVPYVGCAGPVLPISAQVAAGKVFFSDGHGIVRSLSTSGQIVQVAAFPLTSTQQMLSFAVRPDGGRLMAAVFTLPPKPASSGDPCSSGGYPFAPGNFTLDVYSATAGGSSQLLYHEVLTTGSTAQMPNNVMAFIGWDQVGPIGTYPTSWATQGGGPHHYSGDPARIDALTGKVVGQVSDAPSCFVWDMASSGDFLCLPSAGFSVRRPDRSQVWGVGSGNFFSAFLSPDEQRAVVFGSAASVLGRDRSNISVPADFQADEWLDSATVIGGGYVSNLNYVNLRSPATMVDIGFKGMFIGTVRT